LAYPLQDLLDVETCFGSALLDHTLHHLKGVVAE
jgi:hypothetical protein